MHFINESFIVYLCIIKSIQLRSRCLESRHCYRTNTTIILNINKAQSHAQQQYRNSIDTIFQPSLMALRKQKARVNLNSIRAFGACEAAANIISN